MSLTEREYQKFWHGFITYMESCYPQYVQRQPSKNKNQIVPRTWFGEAMRIAAGINFGEENSIQVDLTINFKGQRDLTKDWYKKLMNYERDIKREIGVSGKNWRPDLRPDKPESWIILKEPAHPEEKHWPDHYVWLAEKVHKFHDVFAPIINKIAAETS